MENQRCRAPKYDRQRAISTGCKPTVRSGRLPASGARRPRLEIGARWARGAAAQGLKQRCGINIAIGSGLGAADDRLLVGLLRTEQRQIAHRTELILPPGDVEACL